MSASSIEFIIYDKKSLYEVMRSQKLMDKVDKWDESHNDFLQLVAQSDELLKHEATDLILHEKWLKGDLFSYYMNMLWYLVFVIVYTIHIETRTNIYLEWASFIFCIFNLVFELLQMFKNLYNGKFREYIRGYTNWLELFNFPACLVALTIEDGNVKSSMFSMTICFTYIILMTRFDQTNIGGYVNVIGKIFRSSLKPLIILLILLLGFLFAFRNRVYRTKQEMGSFDQMNMFNQSFEASLIKIYLMMAGEHESDDLGLDEFNTSNLINFFLYFIFVFLLSTLSFNIFTGIAINEINKLIDDANIRIMRNKIEYIYNNQVVGQNNVTNRLIKFLKKSATLNTVRRQFMILRNNLKAGRCFPPLKLKRNKYTKLPSGEKTANILIGNKKESVGCGYDKMNRDLDYNRIVENFETVENLVKENREDIKHIQETLNQLSELLQASLLPQDVGSQEKEVSRSSVNRNGSKKKFKLAVRDMSDVSAVKEADASTPKSVNQINWDQ